MGLVVLISIFASLVLTPMAKRLAWRFDAVSRPDGGRRRHIRPTPEWGGLAVCSALVIGLVAAELVLPATAEGISLAMALIVSAGLLCLLGCYDDMTDMRAGLKLAGQVLATLPVVIVGCRIEQLVVFGYDIHLGYLAAPWTIGWLVLGINAMNLIDGMDGLASTIGIAISLLAAAIAAACGNTQVAVIGVVLAAALAGFLVYNLPPARIYLGDCGSMVVGLVVAVLALRAWPQAGTANLTVAAALLFVPLTDTTLAIVRRLLSGRGVMTADRGHLHHKLQDRGYAVWSVLAFLGGVCLVGGTLAWLVVAFGSEVLAWSILALMIVSCVNRRLFGHDEWSLFKGVLGNTLVRPLGLQTPTPSSPKHTALHPARGDRSQPVQPLPLASSQFHLRTNTEEGEKVAGAGGTGRYWELTT